MTWTLHPGAEHDIADALDFYSEHAGPVVAARFLEEFERVAKLLVENPGFGTPTTKGRRNFPLKVFPYSVVYRNFESGIQLRRSHFLTHRCLPIVDPPGAQLFVG